MSFMRRDSRRGLRIGLLGASALIVPLIGAGTLPLIGAGPAGADYAATPFDYVGIGGDTPQFSLDFLANGDADADPGFNATGDQKRLVTFDAESDANGRAAYYAADAGAESGLAQDPTDVLREGENPTQRTSSSGNAIAALEADTSGDINFVFSTTALTSSNTSAAEPLHEYEFGTDNVELAADSTTNAPANLTLAQLKAIYNGTDTTWTQVGGSSSATIDPLLPPASSAITKTFLAAIGVTATQVLQAGDVTTVEQNDPTAITLSANSANAIVPFSAARYNLLVGSSNYDGGAGTPGPSGPYFPAIPGEPGFLSAAAGESYPASPQYAPPIQLLASAATTTVTDYIDIRQSDLADTGNSSDIEPGSSVNWADFLFAGTTGTNPVTPYIDTPAAQTLILDSGVTPVYVDKGEIS